jgi:hypothetical protein
MSDKSEMLSPRAVVRQVAEAVPENLRQNVIIVGSLAAGYHYFEGESGAEVRTKDVDCLIYPRKQAIIAGVGVANTLLSSGWTIAETLEERKPGDATTPESNLPLVRLCPPESRQWFLELLTVPESEKDIAKAFLRIETPAGHFVLCSFIFLALAEWRPVTTEYGIDVARPEMMALANLLHHPKIGPEKMSKPFVGREIKRSNKDLGRVIALAHLASERNPDALGEWVNLWHEALQDRFPTTWPTHAAKVGNGLRELLNPANEDDFDEAYHTVANGLLTRKAVTKPQLRATGRRLMAESIEHLEELARNEGG